MVDVVDGARPPQRGIPTKDMDARTAVDKNPFEKVDEKWEIYIQYLCVTEKSLILG